MSRFALRGDEAVFARLRPALERAQLSGRSENLVLELDELRLFAKWSSFRGKARWRHAARALFGRPLPRLNEFANLTWLREHGFGAPRPVLAGAAWRGGAPAFQFLFTEAIENARTLDELLEDGPDELRLPALETLGREVGKLHARGFVHRDLFPRNLLVTVAGEAPRIHFLDAWRGGPGFGLRGPAYDLGCLMLSGAGLVEPEEQKALFDAYFGARDGAGKPARRMELLRAAARERRRLQRRFPHPPREWNPS